MALIILAACGGGDLTEPPRIDVQNQPDDFRYVATDLVNLSTSDRFTWRNTGTGATVTHVAVRSGGTVLLTIRDDTGGEVYRATPGADQTTTGVDGIDGLWTIQLDYTGFSGHVTVQVRKQ